MKHKFSLIILCLLPAIQTFAQIAATELNPHSKMELLVGKYKRGDLQKGEFSNYFFNEYSDYTPKPLILEKIKYSIFDKKIAIVMGTWCHDSQKQVPHFIKILDQIDYNTDYLEIICVDENKTGGQTDISKLNIEKVPTFILFGLNSEVGRIIETPNLSLEDDLLLILQNH